MHWLNPAGIWAFSALAAILFLYILKQRLEPTPISSTYLWRQALSAMEADRPFQKLRRSLLMLLQLMLAIIFALSLMRPMTLGGETAEAVFVFDISASMQAESGGKTRLEAAVDDAQRRIEGLPDGARVSILVAGAKVSQPLARSGDPMAQRRVLSGIRAENGGADLSGALSLALALQKELEESQLIVYTDQKVPEGEITQPSVGKGLSNVALLSLKASGTAAVVRVQNFGGETTVTLSCTADGELCDVRSVTLAEDEILSVQFDLPQAAQEVVARIEEPDALLADNVRYWVARPFAETSVVMAGRDNIFMEKALALRSDVTLNKTTLGEISLIKQGALTVIDGPLPETLPEHGALLLIDPNQHVGELSETRATLSAAPGALSDRLNEYLSIDQMQVARWKPVLGGTPIWLADGQPVLSILEENGRRVAVIGFDLHESNLPLLKEFPIFMQHLLSYLAPEPLGQGFEEADCGALLPITPQSFARSAEVITPLGRSIPIPLTGGRLEDTNELGVYRLLQEDEAQHRTEIPFALHIPASEMDVRLVSEGGNQATSAGRSTRYGREWTPWLVGLLLIVALLEWWVYRRGY